MGNWKSDIAALRTVPLSTWLLAAITALLLAIFICLLNLLGWAEQIREALGYIWDNTGSAADSLRHAR
jgi:hypothetical protein